MFRKEAVAVTQHCEALVKQCAELGAQILDNAAAVLAPGGEMIYSTCTFAPEEDEGQVAAFLQRHPEFELADALGMPVSTAALNVRQLEEAAGSDVEILVGAGVSAGNLPALAAQTGARAFHLSGKQVLDSRMTFRREGVPMGLPGFSEFELWQTSETNIRAARTALDAL